MGFPVSNEFPAPLWLGHPQYNLTSLSAIANRAYYLPVSLHKATSFTNFNWRSTTPGDGNYDCGVYSNTFTRLFSTGLLAVGGDNNPALAVTLSPGQYWLALLITSGTCTIRSLRQDTIGEVWVESPSASPLPATGAPTESASNVEIVPALVLYR